MGNDISKKKKSQIEILKENSEDKPF